MQKIKKFYTTLLFIVTLTCQTFAIDYARLGRMDDAFDSSYMGKSDQVSSGEGFVLLLLIFGGFVLWGFYADYKSKKNFSQLPPESPEYRKKMDAYFAAMNEQMARQSSYLTPSKPQTEKNSSPKSNSSDEFYEVYTKLIQAIKNKQAVTFTYTNNRYETATRHVMPLEIFTRYNTSYLRTMDLDKQAERVFNMYKIKDLQ